MWEIGERVVIVSLLLWSAYVTIVKPHVAPVPTESADSIFHYSPDCRFSCARLVVPLASGKFKEGN